MRPSRYNIILGKGQFSYWYNTLHKTFFRMSLGLGNKLRATVEETAGIPTAIPNYLADKLKSGGFIIDDNTDELETVRQMNHAAIEDRDYFLILLPTLNCNYHCWYCIQDHIESRMSAETEHRIRKHIELMVNAKKITSLHIEWFGGEPLMYFNEVIEPLSRYAREVCGRAGIPFSNSATTNGYFLDREISAKCGALDFRHFQITLDGNREFHDKVKFQRGCESTFDHVLDNIDSMLSTIEDAYVILRINYTHRNLTGDIVTEVNSHISPANRTRVRITPRKVWQENIDRDFNSVLSGIIDDFKEAGYSVERWDPITNFIPCYANKRYYNAITCHGHVVKCTACNDMYEEPKGVLNDDGTIKWLCDIEDRYTEPSYENERCLGCRWLPICMGLCPRDYSNGLRHCKQDTMDTPFSQSIINLIDHEYEKA